MAKKNKKVLKKVAKKLAKKKVAKKPVKVKVKSKKKNTKEAADPKERYKKLNDGSIRINGWLLKSEPTEKFTELVVIENKKANIYKRFITLDAAIKWIEVRESERLIINGIKHVALELKSIGLGPSVENVAEQRASETSDVSVVLTSQSIVVDSPKEEIEVDADQ